MPAAHKSTSTVFIRPFPFLSPSSLLAHGSCGHVFAIGNALVFKCAFAVTNPAPSHVRLAEESRRQLENEKKMYRLLRDRPHANILDCALIVDEGIFLARMPTSLQQHVDATGAVSDVDTCLVWTHQMASALAWLELLGFAHGDFRPANILLSADWQIKVGDFDAAVPLGHTLTAATEPYCRLGPRLRTPQASAATEQFALASCVYFMRWGHEVFHELDPPTRVRSIMEGHVPSTEQDVTFGALINQCWKGEFSSMAELQARTVGMIQRGAHDCTTTASPLLPVRTQPA
ncbi:kinase-like domain-containing protein [Elsinoe ampelina]|uniref:Kinase-like domain-containing protein n=1 Tax=Elsinoe ampelina TaxID=302913 RepID=A0A6A6GG80_9PEZI|nr:kinase-like domain-containing protein [Elsinoe ampelina]